MLASRGTDRKKKKRRKEREEEERKAGRERIWMVKSGLQMAVNLELGYRIKIGWREHMPIF